MFKGPRRVCLRDAFTLCLALLALTAVLSFATNGWSLLEISRARLSVTPLDLWLRVLRFIMSGLALALLLTIYGWMRREIFQPFARFAASQPDLLTAAVAAANDAVVILQGPPDRPSECRIVYVNPAFERQTGYRASEALGRSPDFLLGPEHQRALGAKIGAQLSSGRPILTRASFRRRDGSELWEEINVVPLIDQDHWMAVGRDLTERLASEQALEVRNRELATERTYVRNLIDHVPLGIAAFDTAMNYRWVNDFYAALRCQPREWFVGQSLYEVWPGSRDAFEQPSREILASGRTLTYKAWQTPSLPGRYWDVTGLPLYDPDRNPEGLLVLVQDVTEQTKISRLQRAQLQKLQELDRLKDHLLSNLSHELKTPISLIVGYTELLQDQYPEEPLLQGILEGTRRLVAHLNALLDYNAMITGSLPLYLTEICFEELLSHAGEIEHEALTAKHLQLERTVAPDLPPVVADARRLTQVLVELLDNAIKHTPEHGRVGLEATAADGGVRLTVCDSGGGVDPAMAGRIWEPFLQAEADVDRKGGLGLGLAIVRQLVTMHGGRVEVAPRPEGGSCFHVYLPAAPAT